MSSSSSIQQSLPPPSPPPSQSPPSYNAYKVGDIVNARHGEQCRENYEAKILRIDPPSSTETQTETVRVQTVLVRWSINGISENININLIQSHSTIDLNGGRPTRRKRRPDWFDSKNRNNLTAAEVASVCCLKSEDEGEDYKEGGGEEDFVFKADGSMNKKGAEKGCSTTSMNYAESEDDELDMVPKRKKKRSPRRRSIFSNSSSNNNRVNSNSKKKRRGNKRIALKRRGVTKVKQPVVSQNYSDSDESEHSAEEKEEGQLEKYNNGSDGGSKNGSDNDEKEERTIVQNNSVQYNSVAFASSASMDNIEDYIERTLHDTNLLVDNEGDVPLSECSITNENRDEDGGENHGDESLSMSDNDNYYYNDNENELKTWVGNILYSNNADEDQVQNQTGADDPISIDVDSGGDGISGAGVIYCDKGNNGWNEAFVDTCSEVEVESSCKHVDIEYLSSNQESERSDSFLDEDIQIKIKSATKEKVANSTVPLVESSIRESLTESIEDDDCIDDDTPAASSSNSIQTQEDYPLNRNENDTLSDNAQLSDEEETLDGGMSYVDDENSIKTQADTDELDFDLDRSESIHVQDDEDSLSCNALESVKNGKNASKENDDKYSNIQHYGGEPSRTSIQQKDTGRNDKRTCNSNFAPRGNVQELPTSTNRDVNEEWDGPIIEEVIEPPKKKQKPREKKTSTKKKKQYLTRFQLEQKVAQLRKEEVTEMNRNSLEGKTSSM